MIGEQETAFLQARTQFRGLMEFVKRAAPAGLRLDEVERELMPKLLALGLCLLEQFAAQAGDGDRGATLAHEGQTLHRQPESVSRRYVSIFGELTVTRRVYAVRAKQRAVAPLDARLGLPADDFSYVLKDWLQQGCVHDSFQEAIERLRRMLGLKLTVAACERIGRQMAADVERFRAAQPPPPPAEEAAILVYTADCKGVPMRRPIEQRAQHGVRRLKGEKANQKQMAAVGAVYSIEPFVRTADEVLDELARRARAEVRPAPQHKQVWAELTRETDGEAVGGKERLFAEMALAAFRRDPRRDKPLVCLMDGERALWELQAAWVPRAVGVLDLFHVLERLWLVAHAFHAEGSPAAEQFVTHRLRMLLEGKAGYLIGGLRRLAEKLPSGKRRTVAAAIGYFERNRDHMRYDEYLAAGYPIGSGVAEGACRHLVKDRLERTGMRWTVEGAQATLELRAVYLNRDWEPFITHYIHNEQTTLYKEIAA